MTTAPAPASQMSCRLLELSGELKNRIYRLVLVKPEHVPVVITSSGYDRGGGLLQTCKEIRSEALKIFYYENKFKHVYRRFDITPILAFDAPLKRLRLRLEQESLRTKICDEPCWFNLLVWIRRLHEYYRDGGGGEWKNTALLEANITDLGIHIYRSLFFLAYKLRNQPWDLVEDIALGMRPSLICADRRWSED